MAGRGVQFANASEIFTLLRQGVKVPPNVVASAQRTVKGIGTPADQQVIKNYIGIKRSGRADVAKAVSAVRNIRGAVSDVENAAEMVSTQVAQGANPIPAGVRLVQTMSDKFQDFLKTKLVKNVAVQVGKALGSDAQASKALLLGLRRAASLGGAWAGAIGLGVDIGSRIGLGLFDATARRNATAGKSFDAARQRDINVASFGLQARGIRSDVVAARSLYATVRDALGFDEDTTTEQEKRIEQRAANITRARPFANKFFRRFASSVEGKLVEAARKKGKTVDELTEREVNEVVDFENRWQTSPGFFVRSTEGNVLDTGRQDENGNFIFEDKDDIDPRIRTKLALKSQAYMQWFLNLNATQRKAEYEKIAEEEVIPELLKGEEIRRADKLRAAENTREALFNTPEKKAEFRFRVMNAQADFQAEYARHKTIEFD